MRSQMDIFKDRKPTRREWLEAAEAARRNPFETPDAAERRARYYEQQARNHHQGSNDDP